MTKDLLLMMMDEPVMRVNFDEGRFDVLNERLLPYTMKGKIVYIPDFSEIKTRYDDTQRQIAIRKCTDAFITFLSKRVLSLSRENAKKVYNLFGYSQAQDDISKSKIALLCKAVSLQDNYWIKLEDSEDTWKDVNLRTNSLSEIVAQVSLHGSSLSLQGILRTPEWTGGGTYAKAWLREEDGLYLHKRGANGNMESKIEVMVSHILDKCNVMHVQYEAASAYGDYTCKCKCMTTDELSILPAEDFYTYCNVNQLDFFKEIMKIDAETIYKMWIVDYLISNRDRHSMNWGFYYNPITMEILGCHPLFDHNNSFDIELMYDKDAPYLFDNRMTMKQAALKAKENVDFHFTEPITKADFLTDRQYHSFTERAEDLGIDFVVG